MHGSIFRGAAVAAVVLVASVASASPDGLDFSMSGVADGFIRSGAPVALFGLIGLFGRRQRHWYDDPEVLDELVQLPKLPQDYMYFPR